MPRIAVRREVPANLEEVAALWWDPARWAGFVEGFSHVHRRDDPWPLAGGRMVGYAPHDSPRGRVAEHVEARDPEGGGDVRLEDGRLQGLQRVRFGRTGDHTLVTLDLEYSLKLSSAAVVDLLYMRRRLRAGLQRTLDRLAREAAADRELLADAG
jgi:hypothetical protein